MSGFHACYSLGTLAIASACSLLLHLGASYIGCALVGASAILLLLTQSPRLVPPGEDAPASGATIALPNRATIVLGLCCFACFMTEGACTDWSTIYLRFSRGLPLASAALGYTAFAVAMTASRFGGDHVATRLARRRSCASAARWRSSASPRHLRAFGPRRHYRLRPDRTWHGQFVPLVFSAAARVPGIAAHHSVPAVVGLGYAGFLVGPVVIGLLSNHFGLGAALGLDALLLVATFFAAKAVA